jgi:GNAT superfamily N-acetyltransferase
VQLSFRTAMQGDYARFARLFPELGAPEPTPSEEWFFDRAHRVLFACDRDEVVAYTQWDTYVTQAHVAQVVVDRSRRRQGIGSALLAELRSRLGEVGCVDWYLHVRRGNETARRLYERFGLRREWTVWVLEWDATQLPTWDLRGHTEPAMAFAPTADDDLRIEEGVGIHRGRLSALRARGEIATAVHTMAGMVVGFSAIDPQARRAANFRVAHADYAATLLESLRALVPSGPIHLPVERDEVLAAAFRAAGMKALFEMDRMSGSISRGAHSVA